MLFAFTNHFLLCFMQNQDPSQPKSHSLLQGHSLRRCRGVGLCLENVQECHPCIWSLQAQVGHGLRQSALAFEQVRATCYISESYPQSRCTVNDTLIFASTLQVCNNITRGCVLKTLTWLFRIKFTWFVEYKNKVEVWQWFAVDLQHAEV